MCVDLHSHFWTISFFFSKVRNLDCLIEVMLKEFSSQSELRRIFQAKATSGNLEGRVSMWCMSGSWWRSRLAPRSFRTWRPNWGTWIVAKSSGACWGVQLVLRAWRDLNGVRETGEGTVNLKIRGRSERQQIFIWDKKNKNNSYLESTDSSRSPNSVPKRKEKLKLFILRSTFLRIISLAFLAL